MPITVACSECGKTHLFAEDHAGMTVSCGCGGALFVPDRVAETGREGNEKLQDWRLGDSRGIASSRACLTCGGQRVVDGWLELGGEGRPGFALADVKVKLTLVDTPTLPVSPGSQLCLDCGLVWTTADPRAAVEKVRKFGRKELKTQLKLNHNP